MVILLLALGCSKDQPVVVLNEDGLSPQAFLRRASLDLRGIQPSLDEIAALDESPDALESMVGDFVYDPGFGQRVRDQFSVEYLTRTETESLNNGFFIDNGIDENWQLVIDSGEEPLMLLSRVAVEDLPWTDIVTADWTMATADMAEVYGLSRTGENIEGAGADWEVAHYEDGRPAAGVLAQNALWWRYRSSATNFNRGRVNALTRILLCVDLAGRGIDFDSAATEDLMTGGGTLTTSCLGCHSTLDPMASFLYGFWYLNESLADSATYHPEREDWWKDYTGVSPAYFGTPGTGLDDLGRMIAADPRFAECVTRQTFTHLVGREPDITDFDEFSTHRDAFIEGGSTLRSVVMSVVDGDNYRGRGATPEDALKLVSPSMLSSQFYDLTGYSWIWEDMDMLRTDRLGLRVIAGGVDGASSYEPAVLPSPGQALVLKRLAENASWFQAANQDQEDPTSLFYGLDLDRPPTDNLDVTRERLGQIRLRLYGALPSDAEVDEDLQLLDALIAADASPRDAWAGLLSVLLRDSRIILY